MVIEAPPVSNGSPSPVIQDLLPTIDPLQKSESTVAGEVDPLEAPASNLATSKLGSVADSPVQGHAQSIEQPPQTCDNDVTDVNKAEVSLANGHRSTHSPSAPPAASEEPAAPLVNGIVVNRAAQSTRSSSRQNKSLEKPPTNQYETPSSRRSEKFVKPKNSRSPGLTRSKQSLTPELSRSNVPRSKKRSPSQMVTVTMTSGTSPGTEGNPEEDASYRMAMQLQQQEFGLRSRRNAS